VHEVLELARRPCAHPLECNRQGSQEGEIEAINLLDSKTRPFLLNSRDNAVNKLVLTVGLLTI